MRYEEKSGLRILYPSDGLVLFKPADKDREYHEIAYLAKNETLDDYAEVSRDYAYGYSQDGTIDTLINTVNVQSDLLDLFVMNMDPGILSDMDHPMPMMLSLAKGMSISEKPKEVPQALVNYLVMRIKNGKLDYDAVIAKYPDLKDAIDNQLEK